MSCKHCCLYKGRSMWHKTLLLFSVFLSFTSAESQHSFVQNDKRYSLAVQGSALIPTIPDTSDDDFQASHAIHLKTSNGVNMKLLISLPPDLQPVDEEETPTDPAPPAPVEDDSTAPESPVEDNPSLPEVPAEIDVPSDQPPLTPVGPSIPSGDGQSPPVPIVIKTINGVHLKLHLNIPPEFQHIIEAHQTITVPGSMLPSNPIPLPIVPKPEPVEDEPQTPAVPEKESENAEEDPLEEDPQEPQRPVIPKPEQTPEEPISVPEEKPIGLKPVTFETQNGIKLKLFVDIPPHLASLIGIEQSIEGLPSPSIPNVPGNENPSAPGAETEAEVPDTPLPEVPADLDPDTPFTPEVEDPAQPESPVPSPGTGDVIKVPDSSDLVPKDQHIQFATDSGVLLHMKVNSPARVRHLVQQQSEMSLVKN